MQYTEILLSRETMSSEKSMLTKRNLSLYHCASCDSIVDNINEEQIRKNNQLISLYI